MRKHIISGIIAILLCMSMLPVTALSESNIPKSSYKFGDIVKFGCYEQDGRESNGMEAIEWIVLDETEDSVLLVSRYILDAKCFNSDYADTSWEECSLRKWLNNRFLNAAFSEMEQACILETEVIAHENPYFATDPGENTTDKVFLLSTEEVKLYFDNNDERMCKGTKYALKQNVYVNKENKTSGWWLRTPGDRGNYTSYVVSNGSVEDAGEYSSNANIGVRPAIWVQLAG